MPTPTYTALANITLGSSASSVTFSSIPATYRDLVLVANFQMSLGGSRTDFRLNGDTGGNYNDVSMSGYGSSSVGSNSRTSQTSSVLCGFSAGPLTTFSNIATLQLMDYSATDKHKTGLSRYGAAAGDVQASAHRYASTSAITSVAIVDLFGSSFVAGSTFALYGIAS
jgi:hypothetical protein